MSIISTILFIIGIVLCVLSIGVVTVVVWWARSEIEGLSNAHRSVLEQQLKYMEENACSECSNNEIIPSDEHSIENVRKKIYYDHNPRFN